MGSSKRFRQEWNATLDRVGWTPKDRLAWAVRAVQASRRDLTPGDRDNLRRELGVFASGPKGGGAEWSAEEGILGPEEKDMPGVLEELGRILQAAVKRERVTVARRVAALSLVWDPGLQEGPYPRSPHFVLWDHDEDDDWEIRAKRVLCRLLVEHGHLLKECGAPEPRGGQGDTCGTWFVANRSRQAYCSPRCQTRAATRAYRVTHVAGQTKSKRTQRRRAAR